MDLLKLEMGSHIFKKYFKVMEVKVKALKDLCNNYVRGIFEGNDKFKKFRL